MIQANLSDKFQYVINKYLGKTLLNPESVAFILNGKQLNPSESVQSHMSKLDKEQNKLKVLVNVIESNNAPQEIITKSEEIICPECKESCRIAFEDYKIKLYECPNKHERKDINIPDFSDTQMVNESKIVCEQCKFKNKGNCPKNEFYRCLTCSKNICLLCKSNHDKKHNIIEYNQRNYICQTHNEPLIKYCTNCKTNICFSCEGHGEHIKVDLGDLIPSMEENKNFLNEMKTVIDSIDLKIKETINILNKFSDFMKKFYEICNTIVENYNVKNRNYQILQNLREISANNIIYNKLKDIKIKCDINDIIHMYRNINKEIQNKENINIKDRINMFKNINKEIQNKENINIKKEKQHKENVIIKKEIQNNENNNINDKINMFRNINKEIQNKENINLKKEIQNKENIIIKKEIQNNENINIKDRINMFNNINKEKQNKENINLKKEKQNKENINIKKKYKINSF